jgi:polyhydroxybutyrate depolymerase
VTIRGRVCCTILVLFSFFAVSAGRCQNVRNWTVAGATREALIFQPTIRPAPGVPLPVVFAFHGHGGGMYQASRSFKIQQKWPEALVVYMQGLPTPGALTDPTGAKNGWQARVGDLGNRDIKFFDSVLKSLTDERIIDPTRVFVTGHSNGGGFTYLLWQCRANKIRALAPVAAIAAKEFYTSKVDPKPILHIMGERDPLVRPRWQEMTIDFDKRVNSISGSGSAWVKAGSVSTTMFASSKGTPVVVGVHPGGHVYPEGAADLIVKFFKQYDLMGAASTQKGYGKARMLAAASELSGS